MPSGNPKARVPWINGTVHPYRGIMISCVEEDHRRFWAFRRANQWSLRQEFCSYEDATHHIDNEIKEGRFS